MSSKVLIKERNKSEKEKRKLWYTMTLPWILIFQSTFEEITVQNSTQY